MLRRRRAGAVLVSLLVLGLLAGCDVGGSLADKARIDFALRELATSLEELDGVSATYTEPELRGDYTYSLSFTIESSGASADDLVTAIDDTRRMFSDPLFERQSVYVSVDAGDTGSVAFESLFFDIEADELAGEIRYWLAVQEVVRAPVSLNIFTLPEVPGTYYASMGIGAQIADIDFAGLGALPEDLSAMRHVWGFGGLMSSDLPPPEVIASYVQLLEIVPALDYSSESTEPSIELYWSPARAYLTVYLQHEDATPIEDDQDWPRVLDLLATAVAGDHIDTFTVQPSLSSGDGFGIVTLAPCGGEVAATPADPALFELLSGRLPEGAFAGSCADR